MKLTAVELGRAMGAAESLRTRVNVRLEGLGSFLRAQQRAKAIVRATTGPEIESAVAAGRELDHHQAILLGIPQEPEGFAVRWQGLPPELKRVVTLASQNRTSKEIGTEVQLSRALSRTRWPPQCVCSDCATERNW